MWAFELAGDVSKVVEYQNRTLVVAGWVNYIAVDKDGSVFGFTGKPTCDVLKGAWCHSPYLYLGYFYVEGSDAEDPYPDWELSLEEV